MGTPPASIAAIAEDSSGTDTGGAELLGGAAEAGAEGSGADMPCCAALCCIPEGSEGATARPGADEGRCIQVVLPGAAAPVMAALVPAVAGPGCHCGAGGGAPAGLEGDAVGGCAAVGVPLLSCAAASALPAVASSAPTRAAPAAVEAAAPPGESSSLVGEAVALAAGTASTRAGSAACCCSWRCMRSCSIACTSCMDDGRGGSASSSPGVGEAGEAEAGGAAGNDVG